jgi:hypothetical protein
VRFLRRQLVGPGPVVACVWIRFMDDPREMLEKKTNRP